MIEIFKGYGYSTENTKQETLDLSKFIFDNNIQGDFVECGVAQGVQIGIMELVNQKQDKPRKIWAFDSFEGIPLATYKDDQQPGIGYFKNNTAKPTKKGKHLISSGISSHSLENVKLMLIGWCSNLKNFIFVEGWFEETIEKSKVKKIALLRLDADLYESTKICLEVLYPKLQKGGVLIIDDWALKGCRLACDEYFESYEGLKPLKDFDTTEPMNFIKL